MMAALKDISGIRFGRLVVLNKAKSGRKTTNSEWMCRCDCGIEKIFLGILLRKGITKSCGCYRVEISATRETVHGQCRKNKRTSEHAIWSSMIQRCTNKNNSAFPKYGGRGISVCERWMDFENFYIDMGKRPDKHSIDRVDNNKGYSPENCRWATAKEQSLNRRSNLIVQIGYEKKPLKEWCEILGENYKAVHERIRRYGWKPEWAILGERVAYG